MPSDGGLWKTKGGLQRLLGALRDVAITLRRWGLGRLAIDLGLEVVVIFVGLKTYNELRNQLGSLIVSPAVAHSNALKVINFESNLNFFFEQRIQHHYLQWPDFVRFWNVFYCAAHTYNNYAALLAMFFLRPLLYQRIRSALMIMNCWALVGDAVFPLMPPRLVPHCGKYGGCDGHFTFVDTMATLGGIGGWRGSAHAGKADLSNHYAAMPSMHFGYALWFCIATVGLLQGPPPRPAAPWPRRSLLGVLALYPPAVLFCIVLTANHYILDAICGASVAVVSYQMARFAPEFGRGVARDWGPAMYWLTGPNSSVVAAADGYVDPAVSVGEGIPLLPIIAPTKQHPGGPSGSHSGSSVAQATAYQEAAAGQALRSASPSSSISSRGPALEDFGGGGGANGTARAGGVGADVSDRHSSVRRVRQAKQGTD